MDFLISASNTPYNQWQLSLLIESFKQNNLDNNLVVVCSNPKEKNPIMIEEKFVKNILNHKRFYRFYDQGSSEIYEPLNKLYIISYLLKENLLKQPFLMFLEPDLVMKKEFFLPKQESIDFLYSVDPSFTFKELENNRNNFWMFLGLKKELLEEKWLEVGNIVAFNNFSEIFFDNLTALLEVMVKIQGADIWKGTFKFALIASLIKINPVRITRIKGLEVPAFSFLESNFITYREGMPPDFHKSMFKYDFNYFSMGNPLEILSNIYNCPNAKYISDLAKNILASK